MTMSYMFLLLYLLCFVPDLRQQNNGKSSARVEALMERDECECSRKTCFWKFSSTETLKKLIAWLEMFWSLSKICQDNFVTWFAGQDVKNSELARLMGMYCSS